MRLVFIKHEANLTTLAFRAMPKFILPRHILREHLGPFCFSFAVITLLFLLDLLFRNLNRILSKGLPLSVVAEFLALNLAWIIATAVPMAVLTATLMAFGRLAADNELVALQAAGVSLRRQMAPVFGAAALLAAVLIWFNNNILPDSNLRVRTLATEIINKKPSVNLEPGVWFDDIPNYGLLAQALEDSAGLTKARHLLIDDNSRPEVRRTISARAGLIQAGNVERGLLLTLFDGEIQEIKMTELEGFRRLTFAKQVLSLGAKDLPSPRDETEVRNDREKSTHLMWQEVATARMENARHTEQLNRLMRDELRALVRGGILKPEALVEEKPRDNGPELRAASRRAFTSQQRRENLRLLLSKQKSLLFLTNDKIAATQSVEAEIQSLLVEIHKKYAIPAACLVFVLIGAPLGALTRRGGLATGAGLGLGFFLLYWTFLIGGESLADREILSPFFAMWFANILTAALGIIVFRYVAAGNLAPPVLRLPCNFAWEALRRPLAKFIRKKTESTRTAHEHESAPRETEVEFVQFDVVEPEYLTRPLPMARRSSAHFDAQTIDKILRHLISQARLRFVLLGNRNGVVLAHGEAPWAPRAQAAEAFNKIAALCAAQMAVIQIMGKSVEEDGEFTCVFQEGERYNLFTYQVDEEYLMTALVERTVALGRVRLHANAAVANIRAVLRKPAES